MKKYMNSLAFKALYLTNSFRPLPNFLIIGAQKSGTSSLFSYLSQHSQIRASYKKEIHYFDGGINPGIDSYLKGESFYRAHFPIISRKKGEITGEASPLYLLHPLVAERIYKLIPNVKLIAILRNPTERAISHYYHTKRSGFENLSLMDALKIEEKRLEKYTKEENFDNHFTGAFSYKTRGLYKQQLDRFFKYFPQKNFYITSTEEMSQNPSKVLSELFDFLGVEKEFKIKNLTPKNVASNKDKVESETYEYLQDYFRSHNQDLYKLLNKDFGW